MILCISVLSVVISPFSFLILLIWFFSLCFLMSLANGLSILFIITSVFLPWEPLGQYKKAKIRAVKDELPRLLGDQCNTGDQWELWMRTISENYQWELLIWEEPVASKDWKQEIVPIFHYLSFALINFVFLANWEMFSCNYQVYVMNSF